MDYSSMLQAQEQAPFQGVGAAPVAEQPLPQSSPPAEQQQPGFLEKLRTNPALSQAALMMGARMMMGPKPGQDALGVLGESMMIGNHTFTMGKQNEVENEQAAARTGSEVKRNDAVTARTEQQTAQDAEQFPMLKEKLQADIIRLKAAGQHEEARARVELYNSEPARLAEMYGLTVKKEKADIRAREGQAASGFGSANAANARAEQTRDEMKDPSKYRGAGPNAALTRSTFLPQLVATTVKEIDLLDEEILNAKSSERPALQEQKKALTAELKGYKKQMASMGAQPGEAAPGAKPAASPTMPAAPGANAAVETAAKPLVREVDIQASLTANPGRSRQDVVSSLKAQGFKFAPDVK